MSKTTVIGACTIVTRDGAVSPGEAVALERKEAESLIARGLAEPAKTRRRRSTAASPDDAGGDGDPGDTGPGDDA